MQPEPRLEAAKFLGILLVGLQEKCLDDDRAHGKFPAFLIFPFNSCARWEHDESVLFRAVRPERHIHAVWNHRLPRFVVRHRGEELGLRQRARKRHRCGRLGDVTESIDGAIKRSEIYFAFFVLSECADE